MKKMMTVLLALTLLVVSSGCDTRVESGEIGQVCNKRGFEYRVNYIEFADTIDGWEGANDNFWMSLDDDSGFKPVHGSLEEYRNEHGVKASREDSTILIVSFNAKNVSKEDKTLKFDGVINYDDGYEYKGETMAYRVNEDACWNEIPNGIVLEKLIQSEYEYRAYIIVPKEVETSDKSLTFKLLGTEFKLR